MARPTVFKWPAPDTQAVSLTQSLGAAGNLLINGTLANLFYGNAVFPGIYRKVTLTSVNNLAAINFTITGTYQGNTISEVLAGPNNNTVSSVNLYDSITSISTNGAVAAVSSGTGTTGKTHWFNSNNQSRFFNLSIQVVVAGTINYTFQTTLDDLQTVATPTTFNPIVALIGATTSQLASYSSPTLYSSIVINSSTNGSLVSTFLQQGIT